MDANPSMICLYNRVFFIFLLKSQNLTTEGQHFLEVGGVIDGAQSQSKFRWAGWMKTVAEEISAAISLGITLLNPPYLPLVWEGQGRTYQILNRICTYFLKSRTLSMPISNNKLEKLRAKYNTFAQRSCNLWLDYKLIFCV